MRRRPLTSWRGWVPVAALSLLSFGCASASQTADSTEPRPGTESWADEVDPQDVRVLGTVAEVGDETFTLKTFGDDKVYRFEIPSDATQQADVRTGNEVQVWYDPEGFERDGNLYYRAARIETAEADVAGVESGEPTELSATAEVDVDATTAEQDLTVEQDLTDDELRAESLGVDEPATQDELAQDELSRQGDFAEDELAEQDELAQDEFAQDEQTLPQTAGTLPLVAVGGLLALFAAVALRLHRR